MRSRASLSRLPAALVPPAKRWRCPPLQPPHPPLAFRRSKGERAGTAVFAARGSLRNDSQLRLPNIFPFFLSGIQDILGRLLLSNPQRCLRAWIYSVSALTRPLPPSPSSIYMMAPPILCMNSCRLVVPDGPPGSDKPRPGRRDPRWSPVFTEAVEEPLVSRAQISPPVRRRAENKGLPLLQQSRTRSNL